MSPNASATPEEAVLFPEKEVRALEPSVAIGPKQSQSNNFA